MGNVAVGCAGPRTVCAPAFSLFCFIAFAERFISRLTREFLLAFPDCRTTQKKPKGLAPTLALRCAAGSLIPSPLQGHGTTGHPWPDVPLAASLPLNPPPGHSLRPA